MASILFVLAAVGTEPAALGAEPAAGEQRAPAELRPFHEIQAEISNLLKREAQARDRSVRAAAIAAMCALHADIVADPRYGSSDVLKEYRARLWSRLTRVKGELKQQLARSGRDERASLESLAALERADAKSAIAADSLAASLSLLGEAHSGPTRLLRFGGAAMPPDWGPDLVDLIERTINPSFWDVAGGPGTIVYYRPLMCLVVRATAEVHGQIGGAVGGLRAAGR